MGNRNRKKYICRKTRKRNMIKNFKKRLEENTGVAGPSNRDDTAGTSFQERTLEATFRSEDQPATQPLPTLTLPQKTNPAPTNRASTTTPLPKAKPVCRLCMKTGTVMVNIFADCRNQESLVDKIQAVTGLVMVEGDGLPHQICPKCSERIADWFNYKQLCYASDTKFRALSSAMERAPPGAKFILEPRKQGATPGRPRKILKPNPPTVKKHPAIAKVFLTPNPVTAPVPGPTRDTLAVDPLETSGTVRNETPGTPRIETVFLTPIPDTELVSDPSLDMLAVDPIGIPDPLRVKTEVPDETYTKDASEKMDFTTCDQPDVKFGIVEHGMGERVTGGSRGIAPDCGEVCSARENSECVILPSRGSAGQGGGETTFCASEGFFVQTSGEIANNISRGFAVLAGGGGVGRDIPDRQDTGNTAGKS